MDLRLGGTSPPRKCCPAAMEHANMADEKRSDQLAVSKPEVLKSSHSSPPRAETRPPISNDGLELPRSSHC
jgi:hypothetical protein